MTFVEATKRMNEILQKADVKRLKCARDCVMDGELRAKDLSETLRDCFRELKELEVEIQQGDEVIPINAQQGERWSR